MNEADIYGKNDPGTGAGLFFKLKDEEEARIRIVSDSSEAVRFESLYKPKNTLSLRFAWVIYNFTAKKPQVWQASGAVYGLVKNLITNEDYGDVTKYDIKVKREGEETDTKYFITPGRNNYELPEQIMEECRRIDLKAVVSKNDSNSEIMTLQEFHDLAVKAGDGSGFAKAKATAQGLKHKESAGKVDAVVEDISDEPVNLDDIPF